MMTSFVVLVGSLALAALPEPCQQMKSACVAAGFTTGAGKVKGKRLYKDCMQPLMDGRTVSGVAIDPLVVEACKARGRTGK